MVRIITDSIASITPEVAKERDIEVVSLFLHYDRSEHRETDMDIDGFYETLEDRIDDIPTSSQPSQHTFEAIFKRCAKAGDDVLGVFVSGELSGTLDGAIQAAQAVKRRRKSFQFAMVDSASAGSDEGFAVLDAADGRDGGDDLAECAVAAENAVRSSRILFAPESLTFLRAGGRIGAASALIGNIVKITPVLTVTDGVVEVIGKVRTQKKAAAAMIERLRSDAEAHGLKRVVVHYIGKRTEQLARFRQAVEEFVGHVVEVLPVSPVIGVHVGPAIGLAYECASPIEGKIKDPSRETIFTV